MKYSYWGHACFSVDINGKKILFDPFITPNELAKDIDVNKIEADYILVSHGHGDHVADLMTIAKRTGAKVVANFEITEWVNKQGHENTHPMNTGGVWDFDFGSVKCVVAQHSSVLPDGTYAGNPNGFVIMSSEGNFYYAGDTGLTMDMKLIPEWTKLDFAILPVGDNFTMGITDGLKAAKMVQVTKVIGVHYDTFGFIKIDKEKGKKLFNNAGCELLLPAIGETIEL